MAEPPTVALDALSCPLVGLFRCGSVDAVCDQPASPSFTPVPDSWVDSNALHAGETALQTGDTSAPRRLSPTLSRLTAYRTNANAKPSQSLAPTV